jgi:hypothetical protein
MSRAFHDPWCFAQLSFFPSHLKIVDVQDNFNPEWCFAAD